MTPAHAKVADSAVELSTVAGESDVSGLEVLSGGSSALKNGGCGRGDGSAEELKLGIVCASGVHFPGVVAIASAKGVILLRAAAIASGEPEMLVPEDGATIFHGMIA